MKLTAKRDRWYFWRELFSYMIPMILIVGIIDLFFNFMQCPLHPEYSAPCNIIWINAVGYGVFLIITIIFAIFSAKKLRKIKKRIENEFLEAANQTANKSEDKIETTEEKVDKEKIKTTKPKKIITKSNKKEPTKKVVKKGTKKEIKKTAKSSTKKESTTKKTSSKK